jgi:hypothetical protein
VTRTNRGAEGIGGRVKFLPLTWAGMPKTSFRSDDLNLATRKSLSFKLNGIDAINKISNLELFSERTSSIIVESFFGAQLFPSKNYKN